MRAIEIKSKTDKSGHLKIDYKVGQADSEVRVLIIIEEPLSEAEEESLWLRSIERSPAFNFLNEPGEDIYSLKDGQPVND
jgi:hypothetical protein